MWIFSKTGFVSVVQHKRKTDLLVVRARVEADIEHLRQYMPALTPSIPTSKADYPYRAFIEKKDFAEGLGRLAMDIDYTNFKSMVEETNVDVDPTLRYHTYGRVWAALIELEELDPRLDRRWASTIVSKDEKELV